MKLSLIVILLLLSTNILFPQITKEKPIFNKEFIGIFLLKGGSVTHRDMLGFNRENNNCSNTDSNKSESFFDLKLSDTSFDALWKILIDCASDTTTSKNELDIVLIDCTGNKRRFFIDMTPRNIELLLFEFEEKLDFEVWQFLKRIIEERYKFENKSAN